MNQELAGSAPVQVAGGGRRSADPPRREPLSEWGVVGRSARIREVIDRVAEVAASRRGVLIVGEPGTGRSSVARAIHGLSLTPSGPFVTVDCQRIASADAQVVFFGTERARSEEHGPNRSCEVVTPGSLVHQALGGTLYLRHLEELPDRVQAKLARLLRDGEASIGWRGAPEPITFRPIASATHGSQSDVTEGRVRADLYRRFAECIIPVPSLRERPEDIPILAAHLIERACLAAAIPVKRLTGAAETLLSAVPWRGNLRELRDLLETVVRNTTESEISLDEVVGHLHLETAGTVQAGRLHAARSTLREARARFEHEYIAAVLSLHRGRIGDTAKALGIQRTNLYRKLRTLHIKLMQDGDPRKHRPGNG